MLPSAALGIYQVLPGLAVTPEAPAGSTLLKLGTHSGSCAAHL
jgi:hypothetical protein